MMSTTAPASAAGIRNEDDSTDITLFVACYNEKEGIIPTLQTLVETMREIGRSYDIVVVDDASTDNSVQLVRDFMAAQPKLPIKLVVNLVNMGLGSNYAEAAFHGRGKYYRLNCGDNVEDKEGLVTIFRHIGEADLVLPYHLDASCRGFSRRLISRAFTTIVNILCGQDIHYYNGGAIVRRYDVMRWHSNSHGFGFQADLISRLLEMGATYVEVGVNPRERDSGSSKALKLQNLCSVAHTLIDISIRRVARLIYPKRFANLRTARNQPIRIFTAAGEQGSE